MKKVKITEIKERFIKKFGYKFDYSFYTEHKTMHTKINIKCNKCNKMFDNQSAVQHLKSKGCPLCENPKK